MAASMEAFKSYIFLMTFYKVSYEKVEATYKREAIGFDFPILASSAKAPSTEVGLIVPSLSMIKSRA